MLAGDRATDAQVWLAEGSCHRCLECEFGGQAYAHSMTQWFSFWGQSSKRAPMGTQAYLRMFIVVQVAISLC